MMGETDTSASEIVSWAENKGLPPLHEIAILSANLPLTPERRNLLAVLSLPQALNMSKKDICRHAQIDPATYYRALKDPIFNEYQVKLSRTLIKSRALRHLNKYDEIAMKGDRAALERQMEQNGVLDPKETVVNVNRTDALASCKDKTMAGIEAFGEPVEAEYTIEEEDNVDSNGDDTGDNSNKQMVAGTPAMPDTNNDEA